MKKKLLHSGFNVFMALFCLVLFFSRCETDNGGKVTYDFYVDVSSGSDSFDGSSGSPFKTLTFAVANAGVDASIKIMPGTYEAFNGEVFPIALLAGQQLVGDVPNKGDGTGATMIDGSGDTGTEWVTFLGAEGVSITGLQFQDTANSGSNRAIRIDNETMTVSDNTFNTGYAGVWLSGTGDSLINDNVFKNSSYAVFLATCTGSIIVQNNTMPSSTAIPVNIGNANSGTVISGNIITGNGQVGIQIANGNPQITGNTFNKTTGYTYGAVSFMNGTSKVRDNVFNCTLAVLVRGGFGSPLPDLGTTDDPGGNVFSSVTGYSIHVESGISATIYAVGNTFPNATPSSGSSGDIYNEGSGSIYYTAVDYY